jgi:hypothetical protein
MSRPIVLARERAQEVMESTQSDRWIWTTEDGNFYVTARNASPPAPGAWIFERVIFRGVKKIEPPKRPFTGISVTRVPKRRP